MATKSVGTLKASLLLDTKQWTAGFAHAERTAKTSTKNITRTTGAGVGRQLAQRSSPALGAAGFSRAGQFAALGAAGPAGAALAVVAGGALAARSALRETARIADEVAKRSHLAAELNVSANHMRRFELASALSGKSIKTIVQEFKSGRMSADLERATRASERFGTLNTSQIGTLRELSTTTKEFGAAWQSIKEQFAASIAPAFISGLRTMLDETEKLAKAVSNLGITWGKVGDIATKSVVGLSFAARLGSAIRDNVLGGGSKSLRDLAFESAIGAIRSAIPGASGGTSALLSDGAKDIKPAPLTRGSVEAVRAIQKAGGDPIGGVEKNTQLMLRSLRRIEEHLDPKRGDGRREVKV